MRPNTKRQLQLNAEAVKVRIATLEAQAAALDPWSRAVIQYRLRPLKYSLSRLTGAVEVALGERKTRAMKRDRK